MWQAIIFGIGTLALIYVSRISLHDPRSHGFYRFFAWEAILALILLNIQDWFQNPFAWYQVISWILLILSLLPLIFGVRTLRGRGAPDSEIRQEAELLAFERTTQLVTDGIYKYIRHPLYSSLLLLAWGTFFKIPSLLGELLAITGTLFLIITAKMDEIECTRVFGRDYQKYVKRTKMFIPFVL